LAATWLAVVAFTSGAYPMNVPMEPVVFAAVTLEQPFWLADREGAPMILDTYHRLPSSSRGSPNARCCWQDQQGNPRTTDLCIDDAAQVFVAPALPPRPALDPCVATFLAALRADGIVQVNWLVYWYADTSEWGSIELVAGDGTVDHQVGDDLPCDWQTALDELTRYVGGDEPYGTFELEVASRTVRHTGDAWMPEPEIETLPFAQDRIVTRIL